MKALTLTQPWATAVALGLKRIETRSWSTGYRGPIAIHAAKGFPGWAKAFALDQGYLPGDLPTSAIVATARLSAVTLIGKDVNLPDDERFWGDYSPGRFAWWLDDIVAMPEPVPAKGALGLWEWADA